MMNTTARFLPGTQRDRGYTTGGPARPVLPAFDAEQRVNGHLTIYFARLTGSRSAMDVLGHNVGHAAPPHETDDSVTHACVSQPRHYQHPRIWSNSLTRRVFARFLR